MRSPAVPLFSLFSLFSFCSVCDTDGGVFCTPPPALMHDQHTNNTLRTTGGKILVWIPCGDQGGVLLGVPGAWEVNT